MTFKKMVLAAVALAITVMITSTVTAERANAASTCCQFYSIGQTQRVGLRNTCDSCRVCVINANYSDGHHDERKVSLQPHTSTEFDISGTISTQVIDEMACR
jgi:hypothetical protein